MAQEKNFETRLKKWLKSEGIYPLGTPKDEMITPSCGYYEKRWGGGYSKKGLPDMHLVINGMNLDVELKSDTGRPSELQKLNLNQINTSGSIGILLYPDGFEEFKTIVSEVKKCGLIQELNVLKNAHSSTSCIILMK